MPKTPVLMIAAALLTVSPAFAQNAATTYPARAIKIIVGFAAGGGTDIVARLVAQKMQESFGQSVFVENRPGGNSMLGPDIAARSAPDGYTLLFAATGQMAVSPAVYPKIPYQPLRDFVPVSMVSSYPLIMVVNGRHPATTVKDFIAWAKANPDKTNYASTSAAFTLTSELFKLRTGTPGQAIPFKSGNDSVMSVVSNQVTYAIADECRTLARVVCACGHSSCNRHQARGRMPPHRAATRFQGEIALDVDGRTRHLVGGVHPGDRCGDQAVD